MSQARIVHLHGASGKIRTAQFNGTEHVVVPVVALMEGVIWPVNAETPEFVTERALAVAPSGWNGRPCVGNHPAINGTQVSANTPGMLEKSQFGVIFNAMMNGKKLTMEGWLDPQRAKVIGAEAQDVIARARAGEMIEVSVGAFVVTEDARGEFNGQPYKAIWREIIPDHLAFLPRGTTGACSISMGCGGVRAAATHYYDLGGAGSGNFGHSGRPGEVGGSGGESGKEHASEVLRNPGDHVVHEMKNSQEADAHEQSMHDALHSEGYKLTGPGNMGINVYGHPNGGRVVTMRNGNTIMAIHHDGAKFTRRAAESAGGHMEERRTLRERVKALLSPKVAAAADAEESAELIQYQTILTLLQHAGDSYDEVMSLVNDLVVSEKEESLPGSTPADEAAEEEIEGARLESIESLILDMIGTLSSAMTLSRRLNNDVYPSVMAMAKHEVEIRAAKGARNSAKDMKVVQTMHDNSVMLGAACKVGLKDAAGKSCPCGGGGQSPETAATHPSTEQGEENMTEKVKALIACPKNKFTEADAEWLGKIPEDRLALLAAQDDSAEVKAAAEKKAADEKAAADKLAAEKAAAAKPAAKPVTTEEYVASAPPEVREVLSEGMRAAKARKDGLIAAIKGAAKNPFSDEQLQAKSVQELEQLAQLASIESNTVTHDGRVDFSGIGIPRAAADKKDDVYSNPPDGYALALKANAEKK